MPLTVRRNSPLDRKICLLAYTENPKGCGGRLVDESRGGQGEQTDDTLSNLFICPDPQQKKITRRTGTLDQLGYPRQASACARRLRRPSDSSQRRVPRSFGCRCGAASCSCLASFACLRRTSTQGVGSSHPIAGVFVAVADLRLSSVVIPLSSSHLRQDHRTRSDSSHASVALVVTSDVRFTLLRFRAFLHSPFCVRRAFSSGVRPAGLLIPYRIV